ncbi:aminoglycoside phosphotransferase family protein [Streptomyces sp. NP160]|uniref:aminoglycoside phosphotransferase family protein n=1 Tax=Streptomyces sp. NP160 TaxID=2586637 RepID=UPI0015D60165|nr:aminoglycoside phosphotransferase family protein [Streptomyces sp. NP160]
MSATPDDALHLPQIVLQKADRDGDGGRAWAAALPGVLRELCGRWSLVLGEALPGASESHVVRARTAAGDDVVLKVCVPGDDFTARADVLRLAAGDGVVRLLAVDGRHQALLLEALGPDLAAQGRDPRESLPVVARLLARLWQVPAPASLGPPVDKAADLAVLVTSLAEALPGTASPRVVRAALAGAARRSAAFDPGASRLLHGDAAGANVLRVLKPRSGAPDGYVLCDPQPFVADPAYDLGVSVRDWVAPLRASTDPAATVRSWCRVLADAAACDAEAVWDWALLERVATGLFATSLGAPEAGLALLETAEMVIDA